MTRLRILGSVVDEGRDMKVSIGLLILVLAMGVWAQGPGLSAQPDPSLGWVTAEARAPRLAFRTFDSPTVGGKVSYHVYTPPAYDATEARFPVLYWLHGTEGGIAGIPPMAAFFHNAMQAGRMPPMLVVFVNGLPRRLWADSKDGRAPVETVFIAEVIPDVDRTFRTLAQREGRILEGFSMGGYGAARMGFKHPDRFAGISILAGGPFDPALRGPRTERNPRLREQLLRDVCSDDLAYCSAIAPGSLAPAAAPALRERRTVIRQVVGELDETWALNRQFHERLNGLHIAHDYAEVSNVGHDARALLTALGEGNGRFYRRVLGMPDTERPR
jgi:enterochelin esterase-like enzyme